MTKRKYKETPLRTSLTVSTSTSPLLYKHLTSGLLEGERLVQALRGLAEEALFWRGIRKEFNLQLVDSQQVFQKFVVNKDVDILRKEEISKNSSLTTNLVNEELITKNAAAPDNSESSKFVVNTPPPLTTKKYSGAAELARRMVANGLIKR